jgi:1-phosphofructokinase/tagatose 6-phosphate kinase
VKTPTEALKASREIHRDSNVPVVIITLGPEGAVCSSVFGDWRIHPVQYPEIVSSIGSGDAFLGGLLSYDDLGAPFDECLKAACAASSANTQSLGPGVFDMDDFHSAMKRVIIERVR